MLSRREVPGVDLNKRNFNYSLKLFIIARRVMLYCENEFRVNVCFRASMLTAESSVQLLWTLCGYGRITMVVLLKWLQRNDVCPLAVAVAIVKGLLGRLVRWVSVQILRLHAQKDVELDWL